MSGDDFYTLHEMAKQAREHLSDDHWDYLIGGADTESALKRNRFGLDSWVFRPRILNDVSEVDASTELLGTPLQDAGDAAAHRLGSGLRGRWR